MHFPNTLNWAGTENITDGERTNQDDCMPREKEEKCICSQDPHLGKDSSINLSSFSDQYLAQSRNQLGLAWTIQKLVICRWHITTTFFSSPQLFLLFWCASCPSDRHTLKALQQTPNLAPLQLLQPSRAVRVVSVVVGSYNISGESAS